MGVWGTAGNVSRLRGAGDTKRALNQDSEKNIACPFPPEMISAIYVSSISLKIYIYS